MFNENRKAITVNCHGAEHHRGVKQVKGGTLSCAYILVMRVVTCNNRREVLGIFSFIGAYWHRQKYYTIRRKGTL